MRHRAASAGRLRAGLAWGAMSESGGTVTGRVGVRDVARARRGLVADGLAGDQRAPQHPARDARAGARGDGGARLPGEQRRPRARHPHDPHARRHRLGCDAVRAVGRHRGARGGGARGRPLGRDGVRGCRGRGIRRRRRTAPARPGGRRDHRGGAARPHAADPRGADSGRCRSRAARRRRRAAQAEAAALAVDHLADLGHRRIARLAGPDGLARGARARAGRRRARSPTRGLVPGPRWAGDWSAQRRCGARAGGRGSRPRARTARPRSSSRTTRWRWG